MRILVILFCLLTAAPFVLHAQDDTDEMDALLDGGKEEPQYTFATFKGTRVINGHSIEHLKKKHLMFLISHRFAQLDQGTYDLFGLDQATIRFGLDYAFTDWLTVGVGRSTLEKTYDGYAKLRLLRQSKGAKVMPVSMSLFSSVAVNTLKWVEPERKNYFSSRLAYTYQLIVARKFHERVSLQLSPTLVHHNLVRNKSDENDVLALGVAGRIKISRRVAVNAEWFALAPGETANQFRNALSVGVDIETGGHVFQLHLTNARAMIEKGFIAETTGDWTKGGIHFGFNVTRSFSFEKRK